MSRLPQTYVRSIVLSGVLEELEASTATSSRTGLVTASAVRGVGMMQASLGGLWQAGGGAVMVHTWEALSTGMSELYGDDV